MYKNADTWQHAWVEDLNASGYHCVNIGKMHTSHLRLLLAFTNGSWLKTRTTIFKAQSLTCLLEGEDAPGREYVFAEQRRDGLLTGCEMMTMVRKKEWKLVHYLGNDDGELYDTEAATAERAFRMVYAKPNARR